MLTANEKLKMGETSTIHLFERAGLGKAPFYYTGEMTEKTYCACQGAPVLPGSTCDYCGTCIRYEFWIKSTDGNRFKVGCDCIRKTDDAGLIRQISSAERKLRDMKNAAAKERKKNREAEQLANAKAALPQVAGKLSSQPHPNSFHASQGKTMLDYVNWLLANTNGKLAIGIINHAS